MTEVEIDQNFPSLKLGKLPVPFGWVQWKGTDVCLDIHCECGELTHFDGDFCYHIACGKCGKVFMSIQIPYKYIFPGLQEITGA